MNKIIQEEIDKLNEKIKKLKSWDDTAELTQSILESIPKMMNPKLSIGIEFGQLHGVLLHVDLKKVGEVSFILKQFASHGYHLKSEPEDYPEIHRRSWNLKSETNNTPVIVSGFFRKENEGQQCKFIKVGEKTEPVYKLICEDTLKGE